MFTFIYRYIVQRFVSFFPLTLASRASPLPCVGVVGVICCRKKRDRVNTAADRIAEWLSEVARHFEPQLDGHEIYLPFPTKRVKPLLLFFSSIQSKKRAGLLPYIAAACRHTGSGSCSS